jgi:SEC-C motif-containing protein
LGLYENCCQRFHTGTMPAPDAQVLMRSRYSAYTLSLSTYVLATWHPSTRPNAIDLEQDNAGLRWLGLSVKDHVQSGDTAQVEFVARYKPAGSGRAERLHERSRFVRENGIWFYVEGDIRQAP